MDSSISPVIGIDLGTTNSVVASLIDGQVQVIHEDGEAILPSIVGIAMDGKLVIGQTAKNQLAAFPDRTISSIKRRMGQATKVKLADQEFTPQEISAMILRRLRQRAETALGVEVTRAVITVPAFFDEDQRQATREAGELAGLTVERIINEPTAASLVYHAGDKERRHLIVYDLGGGTFDVSIVRVEDGVVEVLASKGDTHLGGDDFDQLLTKHVSDQFLNQYKVDLLEQGTTRWRLIQACERAKCELSSNFTVRIAEEFITTIDGQPVNLDVEVSRKEYEDLIGAMVERTIECVDEAIRDSGLTLNQLDELILVGGSTRTPLVQNRLREEFHRDLKCSVNPDLAVALGAGTQAAMQSGHTVGPVLIDVATHTLGIKAMTDTSYIPELGFVPVLRRNSPLPARYEEVFYKHSPDQKVAEIEVFQGESPQLHLNRKIGLFKFEGLTDESSSNGEIVIRFELTLDGILKVTAIERLTGLSKSLKIQNALADFGSESNDSSSIERFHSLFENSEEVGKLSVSSGDINTTQRTSKSETSDNKVFHRFHAASGTPQSKLSDLVTKARSIRSKISPDDAQDVDRILGLIENAESPEQCELLDGLVGELDDLLFYLT